jgi:hypothetical protein
VHRTESILPANPFNYHFSINLYTGSMRVYKLHTPINTPNTHKFVMYIYISLNFNFNLSSIQFICFLQFGNRHDITRHVQTVIVEQVIQIFNIKEIVTTTHDYYRKHKYSHSEKRN